MLRKWCPWWSRCQRYRRDSRRFETPWVKTRNSRDSEASCHRLVHSCKSYKTPKVLEILNIFKFFNFKYSFLLSSLPIALKYKNEQRHGRYYTWIQVARRLRVLYKYPGTLFSHINSTELKLAYPSRTREITTRRRRHAREEFRRDVFDRWRVERWLVSSP